MNATNTHNVIGSLPAAQVAVEPPDPSLTNGVKLFEVKVAADVPLRVTGYVNVFAADEEEAEGKVQAQIDIGTLDLEMEDEDFGCTLHSSDLGWSSGADVGIDSIEIVEEDVDPLDVLEDQVKELEAQVTWNTTSLAKRKAFLQSLLTQGDDQQAVAA